MLASEKPAQKLPWAKPVEPAVVEVPEAPPSPPSLDEIARRLGLPAGAPAAADLNRDYVAAAFAERLKTFRVRNSLVVEIRFSARDPVKAARIANAIADAFIRDQIESKAKATRHATELLERKLDGLRGKVAEAEHRVARFKTENNIYDTGSEVLSERQLARLMDQAVVARNSTAEARARYEQLDGLLRRGQRESLAEVLQSATVRMLKEQLIRATRREAELVTRYGPRHPELVKARAEVAEVSAQLGLEIDQVVSNIKGEYKVAAERERLLEQSLSELKDQQALFKDAAVTLRDLEREAEGTRRVYETFLNRYKQVLETQDLQLADARIAERADIPTVPLSPNRKRIVVLAFLAGLGLGFGLTVLLELLSKGLARPEDAEATFGIPHLGSIPLLKRESDGLSDPRMATRVVLMRPDGIFAGALDALSGALSARRSDTAPEILLVASPLPNEGRSVVAANLALLLARRGQRTLLIDSDLRRSTLSQQLGVDQMPGLLDAVAHGRDFEEVILRDTVSGLAVLPAGGAGRVVLSPVDALQAPGFGQRLAHLKAHFDHIVIDAPPILPVVDTRLLAANADRILLITAWQRTPKELVRRALALLGAHSGRVVGLVINQMDPMLFAKGRREGRSAKPQRPAPPLQKVA
jgi:capsular exopolysaccharide synthesis family protein